MRDGLCRKKLEEWERIKSAIGEKYKKKPNKIAFRLPCESSGRTHLTAQFFLPVKHSMQG
jgi:hypothetical protein